MKNRDTNELAELIKARLQTAKEDGENLTFEDIIKEFGLNEEEVKDLSAGGYYTLFASYIPTWQSFGQG